MSIINETQHIWFTATIASVGKKIGALSITLKDDAVGSLYVDKLEKQFDSFFEKPSDLDTLKLMNLLSITRSLENYTHSLDNSYLDEIEYMFEQD